MTGIGISGRTTSAGCETVQAGTAGGQTLGFFVPGQPIPQGSKRIGRRRDGKPIIIDDNDRELSVWRDTVTVYTRQAVAKAGMRKPLTGALGASLTFCLRAPIKMPVGRTWPAVKPDVDKLIRAVFDAFKTGCAIGDDAQIVAVTAFKTYPNAEPHVMPKPGVRVSLWQFTDLSGVASC